MGVPEDLTRATQLYQDAAAQSSPHAQCSLAMCYRLGRNMPVNLNRAIQLYELAALTQEFPRAQFLLAQCYAHGVGVSQDAKMAMSLYAKAAEKGYGLAQNNLAVCYSTGMGCEVNHKKAVQLFTQASEKGIATASANLAYMYKYGAGVSKDDTKARTFLAKAGLSEDKLPTNIQEITFEQEIQFHSFTSKQSRKATAEGAAPGFLQSNVNSPTQRTTGLAKSPSTNSLAATTNALTPIKIGSVPPAPGPPSLPPTPLGLPPPSRARASGTFKVFPTASASATHTQLPPPVSFPPPVSVPPPLPVPDRVPPPLPFNKERRAPPPSRAIARKSEHFATTPVDRPSPMFPPPVRRDEQQ